MTMTSDVASESHKMHSTDLFRVSSCRTAMMLTKHDSLLCWTVQCTNIDIKINSYCKQQKLYFDCMTELAHAGSEKVPLLQS